MLDVYAINGETKAILCKQDLAYRTLIYEGDCIISSTHSLQEILADNCRRHGSSLEGRLEYAEYVLHTSIKLPITVHPLKGIFMVPIRSLNSENSGVISYYQVKRYRPLRNQNRTHIQFKDRTDLIIDVSYPSFDRQYKKTGQLIADFITLIDH